MTTAVVKISGKQYLVREGDVIKVDHLEGKEGAAVKIDDVLLYSSDKSAKIGTPNVKAASVSAKIVKHDRHDKVVGVKMKSKKRYRRYFGHKQPYTAIEIVKIAAK